MKKLILYTSIFLILLSCSHKESQNTVLFENNSKQKITVELYDYWTGKTDTVIVLDTGIVHLPYVKDKLVGLYAPSYTEHVLLTWENASVRFSQKKIEIDRLNQTIQKHVQWSNGITTGESDDSFQWPTNLSHPYIEDWKLLDNVLMGAFADDAWRPQPIDVFSKSSLHAYPSAYSFLHEIADTTGLYINDYVRHVMSTLDHLQLFAPTKKAFLHRFFYPVNNSLKYDSAIQVLSQFFPTIGEQLRTEMITRNENARLKIGMEIPEIAVRNEHGELIALEYLTPYTIIDFWATWCIPCVKQMPVLDSLAAIHKNVTFMSLSVDNLREYPKWKTQIEQYENIQHYWLGDTTDLRIQLGIKGLPRLILVNNSGIIVDTHFPHVNRELSVAWIRHLDRQ